MAVPIGKVKRTTQSRLEVPPVTMRTGLALRSKRTDRGGEYRFHSSRAGRLIAISRVR